MLRDLRNKIVGSLNTLKTLGFKILLLESLRRILRINYKINGIPITDDAIFRALRDIKRLGGSFSLYKEYARINLPYGTLYIPLNLIELISIDTIRGNIERSYGELDVKNKIVIDIGAYIGETTLYFIHKGALKVFAYEPIPTFYDVLVKNVKLNNINDKVHPFNYGVWYDTIKLLLNVHRGITGLLANECNGKPVYVKTKKFSEVLLKDVIPTSESSEIVAKIDCEGCEYALICEPCSALKLVKEYVIEIHGSEGIVIDKMRRCGFSSKIIARNFNINYSPKSIWLFKLRTN